MPYNTLDEIRLRKAQLIGDIRKDEARIDKCWESIVHPQPSSKQPSRWSSLLSTGAGMADAALLGWKLYCRFSGRSPFQIWKSRKKK